MTASRGISARLNTVADGWIVNRLGNQTLLHADPDGNIKR